MCKGGTSTTNTNQNASYTPFALSNFQDIYNRAESVANIPYQPYGGQLVAGLSPTQTAGIGNINATAGAAQPFTINGANLISQSGQPLSSAQINNYYNPYASSVFAAQDDLFGKQMSQATAGLTQAAGGVGADRIAVGQAELAREQGLARGQTAADLYGRALGAAQQQQGIGMGAGAQLVSAGLAQNQAQLGAGSLEQQTQQNQLSAQYQQFLQQLAFPYQQAQFLASIGLPASGAMGGTQHTTGTQTTSQEPNLLQSILGLGSIGYGAYSGLSKAEGGAVGHSSVYPQMFASGGWTQSDPDAPWNVKPINYMAGENHTYQIPDTKPQMPAMPGQSQQSQQSSNPMGNLSNLANMGKSLGSMFSAGSGLAGGAEAATALPEMALPGADLATEGMALVPEAASAAGGIGSTIAEFLPFLLLKRGGKVGYDDGGDVSDDDGVDYSRPLERPAPNLGMWPFNRGMADYKGNVTMYPDTSSALPTPSPPAPGQTIPPAPTLTPPASTLSPSFGSTEWANTPFPPTASPWGAAPQPAVMPPRPAAPVAPVAPPVGATGATSGVPDPARMSYQDLMNLDTFKRNLPHRQSFGEMAKDPDFWIRMGANILAAPSQKGVAGALSAAGRGFGATVDDINQKFKEDMTVAQKAQAVAAQLKEHALKWSQMTPHEKAMVAIAQARLAKEKYIPVNYIKSDGTIVSAGFNPQTNQYVGEDGQPLHGGRALGRNTNMGLPPTLRDRSTIEKMIRAIPGNEAKPQAEVDKLVDAYLARNGRSATPGGGGVAPGSYVGERREFKQGWGTWDGNTWVPDKQ